jgi:hypothetical protein
MRNFCFGNPTARISHTDLNKSIEQLSFDCTSPPAGVNLHIVYQIQDLGDLI